MQRSLSTPRLVLLLIVAMATQAAAGELRLAHAAAQAASPAVVLVKYVLAKQSRGFSAVGQRADAATVGTIVSAEGLIVVSGSIFPEDPEEQREPARPRDFLVRLPGGRIIEATFLGRDRVASLAFLQLKREGTETFPFLRFEPTSLVPGDDLLLTELLPERYGFALSARRAAVAAIVTEPRDLIDVDIRLDESAVGAPAFDVRGRAVGMIITDPIADSPGALNPTQRLIGVLSRQKEPGYPMLLPASVLAPLIAKPPKDSEAETSDRAWLGVTLQAVPRALAEHLRVAPPTGVMVTSVWPGSPAEAAGLAVEDIIVRFDGKPIEVATEDALPDFIDTVQRTGVGHALKMDVVRGGVTRSVDITLGVAPTSAVRATEYRSKAFGLASQDLTLDLRLARAWPETLAGALVTEVETAGWAQVGGLQRGDLIQAVGGESVSGAKDLEARLVAAAEKKANEVILFVLRDPDTLFVRVETHW